MNEEQKIQAQILALLKTRIWLQHQQPTDMIAFFHVNEMIIDLIARQHAVKSSLHIPQLNAEQVTALQQAEQRLDDAIHQSAAVSQILQNATTLAQL